jgi:hypothetical protein
LGEADEEKHSAANGPLVLRAHHLLCLQGFVGMGYSDAFTANMGRIKSALEDDSTVVQVTLAPDVICGACPHLTTRPACGRLSGTERDRAVAAALAVAPGTSHPWRWWLARIGERISPKWLVENCSDCSWFPLGHCLRAIRDLSRSEAARRAA